MIRPLLAIVLLLAGLARADLTPNPTNSVTSRAPANGVYPEGTLGFYIGPHPDFGDDGFVTILALQKTPTGWNSPNAWLGHWPIDLGQGQTLARWLGAQLDVVNVRLAEMTGRAKAPPLAVPEPVTASTFGELAAWVLANVRVESDRVVLGPPLPPTQPGSPPTGPPTASTLLPLWLGRMFLNGDILEYGIGEDGRAAIRRRGDGESWQRARFD